MLTPANVASVCSGEQLSLTCSINQSNYLRWTIQVPHIVDELIVKTVAVDFLIGQAGSAVVIDSTTNIRFFKNSAINTLPLESTLLINNVPTAFNGTRINCIEYGTTGISSELTISVIQVNQGTHIIILRNSHIKLVHACPSISVYR